jgi:predicted glycoside hydrolase/deacetylase ChbG (UPF0249 family)
MKQIILCADDFGQSPAISSGILQLVAAGRLSAVSCMSEAAAWREFGGALAAHRQDIDIGLHFNLTQACPAQTFAARPLGAILFDALAGRIRADALAATLHAQLDRFEAVVGAAPDFVDGHQHVHVVPGIRATLLRELSRRYAHRGPYLRNVNPRLGNPLLGGIDGIKTAILKALNIGFEGAARRNGLACTRGFGGIYSLRPDADFPALMRAWLAQARHGDLLMCHPGTACNDAEDPIAATRPGELQYLGSAGFAAALRDSGVQLQRFNALSAAL